MATSNVLSWLEFAVWAFCAVAVGGTVARLSAMAIDGEMATRVCRWIVKRGSPPPMVVNVYPVGHTTREQVSDDVKRAVGAFDRPREWPAPPAAPPPPKPESTKRKRGKR